MTDDTKLTGGRWVPQPNGTRRWVEDQPKTRARVWANTNEILTAAAASPRRRTRSLGARIGGLLDDLAKALRDDEQDQAAREAAEEADRERRERIAELEAEIRSLKARKPGPAARAVKVTKATAELTVLCEQCDRRFVSVQALRMHERRAAGHTRKAS